MLLLYIVTDISGSMNEMGKIHLQRNLCRYAAQLQLIDQEKYANIHIHFYQWEQNISDISVPSDEDIPALNSKGSLSFSVLSNFLLQNLNDTRSPMTLILSDGNFDRDDYQKFLKWKSKQGKMFIRTVAIGADADLLKLKKISTNNSVYLSENIASAIDSTIFGIDEHISAPDSTNQILQSETSKSAAPEEDWDA